MWRAVDGYLRRHHLALLALFIALGGTSYAAVDRIASSPGTLYACVTRTIHELRLTSASRACPRGEPKIAWNQVGPKGADGAAGDTGPAGAAGADGKTVLNGSGAPSAGLGVIGDFYIDTAASAIYGPKIAGGWGNPTSLIGPPGQTGPAGSVAKQTNTFGPVDLASGAIASLSESCTSSAFPTLIAGGYTTVPAALIGVAATVDGPSGGNAWEVDLVNNSGQHVSFTEFTVCTT